MPVRLTTRTYIAHACAMVVDPRAHILAAMQEAVVCYATAAKAMRIIFGKEQDESSWLDQVAIHFMRSVVQARLKRCMLTTSTRRSEI